MMMLPAVSTQLETLHYFHSYVVLIRINIPDLSEYLPSPDKTLPSPVDVEKLFSEFEVLVTWYFITANCMEYQHRLCRISVQSMGQLLRANNVW